MKKNLQKNTFLFKEHVGLLKASNNYDVYDPQTNEIVLHCREKNLNPLYKIIRLLVTELKSMTPFEIEVFDENDRLIGLIKLKLFPLGNNFEIFDEKGNLVSKLNGSLIGWNFKFVKDKNTIARVTKKWSGIGKELFTSADNYILDIKDDVEKSSPLRLLIFGAVICIDMVLKE